MAKIIKPDGLTSLTLGNIPKLLESPDTKFIHHHYKGGETACYLPGGQLYFQSKLSLDLDGSEYWTQDRPDSQPKTSTKWGDTTGQANQVDSNIYRYFVLPGSLWKSGLFNKGDIGVVVYGLRMAFAFFGDVGPYYSFGEASIAVHRELGFETVRNGRVNRKWGINSGVVTIVFPKSGSGFAATNSAADRIGRVNLSNLQRQADNYAALLDI